MDKDFIFTRNEFAKMLGMTPNAVRMRMRRGEFADESKVIKGKWMFKRPRPNQVNRPPQSSVVEGRSSLIPASSALPRRERRRGITKQGSTNYDNIKNPVTARKFQQHNDLLMLAKAKKNLGHLADKKVEAFLELADKEHDKILKEKQKDAFKDAFALSEEAKAKKARDAMLIAQDEAECGDDCWIGDKYYSHEENRRRKAKDRGGYFY